MSTIEKALVMLRNLPRVTLQNIKDLPERAKIRRKKVNHLLFNIHE